MWILNYGQTKNKYSTQDTLNIIAIIYSETAL